MVCITAGHIAFEGIWFPYGTAIQKGNDFFFYYGREGDSRVALPGLVAEPGCIHRGTYTSVTVIACQITRCHCRQARTVHQKVLPIPAFPESGSALIVNLLLVTQSTWSNWSQHSVVTKTAGHFAFEGIWFPCGTAIQKQKLSFSI